MRLSDLPQPRTIAASDGARVVTLGGGRGQATLLTALRDLDCQLSAVVSIADDGGCSGKLRSELGMAPPGDVRRCLSSLSADRTLAASFEERLRGGTEDGRSVGNLVLAEMARDLGSLQRAVDWAGALLECVGRVIPAAEVAGVLNVYDLVHGSLRGETTIERLSGQPMVATVDGPERASQDAIEAIESADLLFFGPGSFIGSTLAVLTTGNIAEAVVRSRAKRVLVRNVWASDDLPTEDHERVLGDHLLIRGGGEKPAVHVLRHGEEHGVLPRADGSFEFSSPFISSDGATHDAELLRAAIAHHFGLGARPERREAARLSDDAKRIFARYLDGARARLFGPSSRPF